MLSSPLSLVGPEAPRWLLRPLRVWRRLDPSRRQTAASSPRLLSDAVYRVSSSKIEENHLELARLKAQLAAREGGTILGINTDR